MPWPVSSTTTVGCGVIRTATVTRGRELRDIAVDARGDAIAVGAQGLVLIRRAGETEFALAGELLDESVAGTQPPSLWHVIARAQPHLIVGESIVFEGDARSWSWAQDSFDSLIGLRGPWGWSLFAAIWTLALGGVVFKLFYTGRFPRLSTAIYVAMGWLVVVAMKPMLASIDAWTLGWLLAGGVFYTLGTYFYHRESIPYSHAIWHLFVIGGSVCHFVAVSAQVL